ncbi:class I SAM-dependent methyltransferase [Arthrobacter sp.]|uniref:class I SAM-dependent methyltransferase n=1 Tax=Arthrobacter sp. TaxID=1667 RepID=UPI003672A3E8
MSLRDQPPVPNLPGRAPGLDRAARRELGGAFRAGGEHYDAVRPGYPDAAVDFMLPAGARDAADLGAGTGILTALLTARGLRVTAVDPSADMLAQLRRKLPGVPAVEATAEATGLPDAAFDAVLCAQAWHWVDPGAASAEAARILRPGGTLGLVWNQLDVTVPWVHRLSRIMHAGDVHRPHFRPAVGQQFAEPEPLGARWDQRTTPEDLLELAKSRSYYLRAGEATRAKVLGNLRWYLFEHLGHAPGAELALPYSTHAWRAARR